MECVADRAKDYFRKIIIFADMISASTLGKRLSLSAVAVLLGVTAFAQAEHEDSDEAYTGGTITLVSRLDGGVVCPAKPETAYYDFGNTSLYTVFEGTLSTAWSFSVINHWVAADWTAGGFRDGLLNPTLGLYSREALGQFIPFSGRGSNNFVDCAYVTYTPGSFSFSAGKMPMIVGGFDYDDYDFDIQPIATSLFWNSFPVYQYAVTAGWTTPSGHTAFTLQGSINPDNQGLAGGLKVTGSYGHYRLNWSAVLMEEVDALSPASISLRPILSIGNQITFNNWTFTLDYLNCCGDPSFERPCVDGHTLLGTFCVDKDGTWDVSLRMAWNHVNATPFAESWNYFVPSVQGNWFPLRDDGRLRLQGCAGLLGKDFFLTLGMTWNFTFFLW